MRYAEEKKRLLFAYFSAYTRSYGALWNETVYSRSVAMQSSLICTPSGAESLLLERYLALTCIPNSVKKEHLLRLLHTYELSDAWGNFFAVLVQHDHAALLIALVRTIIEWYEKKEHIVHAEIQTPSVPLPDLREELAQWAQRLIGEHADVRITYTVNPALIAGVRLETKNNVAEYSLRRQVWKLSQLCKHKDIRWQ